MANKSKTKCLNCGVIFTAEARNRGRQKYCTKPACRAAAKAARVWRAAHPGYWRSHHRLEPVALQDALASKTAVKSSDCAMNRSVSETPALQDALRVQDPVLIGLIAQLTDSTLQDSIAGTVRRLLELGQDILSGTTLDARKTAPTP